MDIYFIVTTKKTISNPIDYWSRNLHKVRCSDLKLLHDHADITHVRLFSRLSARRFCWGFDATKEEVEAAANDDDDLLAIMPLAAPLVREGRLGLAPDVWALMNGTEQPVLLDCEHKWWSDPKFYRFKAAITTKKLCLEYAEKHPEHRAQLELGTWPGPCARCNSDTSLEGFNYCSVCEAIWCTACVQASTRLQEQRSETVAAYRKCVDMQSNDMAPTTLRRLRRIHSTSRRRTTWQPKQSWNG